MEQRFKNYRQNKLYWLLVNTPEYDKLPKRVGSNIDKAFIEGYESKKCQYQRNWILYAAYVAGKEWQKVNSNER